MAQTSAQRVSGLGTAGRGRRGTTNRLQMFVEHQHPLRQLHAKNVVFMSQKTPVFYLNLEYGMVTRISAYL